MKNNVFPLHNSLLHLDKLVNYCNSVLGTLTVPCCTHCPYNWLNPLILQKVTTRIKNACTTCLKYLLSYEAVNDNIFLFSLNRMMITIKEKQHIKGRVVIVIEVTSYSQRKGVTLLQTLVMIQHKKLLHPTTVKMWMKRKKKMNMLSLVAM